MQSVPLIPFISITPVEFLANGPLISTHKACRQILRQPDFAGYRRNIMAEYERACANEILDRFHAKRKLLLSGVIAGSVQR